MWRASQNGRVTQYLLLLVQWALKHLTSVDSSNSSPITGILALHWLPQLLLLPLLVCSQHGARQDAAAAMAHVHGGVGAQRQHLATTGAQQ